MTGKPDPGVVVIDEAETRRRLAWRPLVEALRDIFAGDIESPPRVYNAVDVPGEPPAKAILMPSWQPGGYYCVKLVNMYPSNASRDLPAVHGVVVLFSAVTGQALAWIDGGELTARRTAAASALAADYLARDDAACHTIIGTGRVARNLAFAMEAVRPVKHTLVWGRNADRARNMAASLCDEGLAAEAVADREVAVCEADIVSTATFSAEPLVLGNWMRPGTHLDLVGSYSPDLRESDDDAMRRATVFCDTIGGAPVSSGDLAIPIADGVIRLEDITDLHRLARGEHPGRQSAEEITAFKSVGASLEDFAAAVLAYENG